MKESQSEPRSRRNLSRLPALFLFAALLLLLVFTQPACSLTGETIYLSYPGYICRTTLVDTANGERRMLVSSMLSRTAPGAAERSFFSYDWDSNGTGDEADARLDWRRYLKNDVVTSSSFTGRSWCLKPAETSCMQSGRVVRPSGMLPSLPAAELPSCTGAEDAALEVSAAGLTMDNAFAFPDTQVGSASAPVTFTVTNASSVGVRVNAVDFIAGADVPDFIKTADGCMPTPAEIIAGRGHLLGAAGTCTFQLQFRPQHRDGIAECAPGALNESCRRRAALFVTGEVDAGHRVVTPVNVRLSGRALGGTIVTEPTEICFASAPALGTCTPFQTLRIRNTSGGDITLTSARLTRTGNLFEARMPFLMSFTLPMGLSIDVPVRFCNVANDPTDGEFTINSSSPTSATTVVTLVNPLNRRCP